MPLILPTIASAETPMEVETVLGEVPVLLRLTWGVRAQAWTIDLLTPAGDPLLVGVRLVLGLPLWRGARDARLPAGVVVPVRIGGAGDPGPLDLETGAVQLLYYTADEIALITARPSAAVTFEQVAP